MEVDRKLCIGCENCVAICAVGAAQMVEGKAYIDKELCLHCGACIWDCPQEAIARTSMER